MTRTTTKTIACLLAGILTIGLAGCSQEDYELANGLINGAVSALEDANTGTTQSDEATPTPSDDTVTEWNPTEHPDYIAITGEADFGTTPIPEAGTIDYATPDQYGRSGTAIGVITKTMRDEGSDRDRHMPDTITGWPSPNPKVTIQFTDGSHYKGYMFNKSHLIAKSLGGSDEADNMITGTRTQNVGKNDGNGGMAYTETKARDWLDANPAGTVTYKATPVYEGTELLPRYVTVDILTSDGTVNEHVVVFNTANGYGIDYQNGGIL